MVNDSLYDSTKQPKPIPNNEKPVWDYVLDDEWDNPELLNIFKRRKYFGFQKYGTYLQPFNGRNAREDLFQELLDALVYAKQLELENDNEYGFDFGYIYYQIRCLLKENFDLLTRNDKSVSENDK